MNFYIKEWPDKTASLMSAAGQRLFNFRNIESAISACGDFYGITPRKIIPAISLPPTNHKI